MLELVHELEDPKPKTAKVEKLNQIENDNAEILNSNEEEEEEDRSELTLATTEECSNTTTQTAKPCATTSSQPESFNLSLVPLTQKYKYAIEPNTDEIKLDTNTDSLYGMDNGETYEEWCKTEAKQCNFDSTSEPVANPPISRERLAPENLTISTRTEEKADTELKQKQHWIESTQFPSADKLAWLSSRMSSLEQFFKRTSIRGVLVIEQHDDFERKLRIVQNARVEDIICFSHKGFKDSHQALKETSARIISCFEWPDFKRYVQLYVACETTCKKFIRLNRTLTSDLKLMEQSN